MMAGQRGDLLDLDGWEVVDGMEEEVYRSRDRKLKVVVKEVEMAFEGSGWMAELWSTDKPYTKLSFEDSVIVTDREDLEEKVRELVAMSHSSR